MNQTMFTVHDSKAMAFITPFFAPNIEVGIRSFEVACNDPATGFYHHPGDYTLFALGEYDQTTAKLSLLETPENLGMAIQYKHTQPLVMQTEAGSDVPRSGTSDTRETTPT